MSANIPPTRTVKPDVAPSGRALKESHLMPLAAGLLDRMFRNHVTYPNLSLRITVEAHWRAVGSVSETKEVQFELAADKLPDDIQAALDAGDMVEEFDSAVQTEELNLAPASGQPSLVGQRQRDAAQAAGAAVHPHSLTPPLKPRQLVVQRPSLADTLPENSLARRRSVGVKQGAGTIPAEASAESRVDNVAAGIDASKETHNG